tara:strand:+ start:26 stop:745 length:720 start_codon:yes stop_codon:yes gene_type:complete
MAYIGQAPTKVPLTSADITDLSVATIDIAANAIDETKLKDALVGDFTEVTIATGDSLLLGDTSDSGNSKRDTVQGLLDLVPSAGFTLGTEQATTSGSTKLFGSIPTGTKIIHILFDEVTLSGTSDVQVQIGDAGGLETSGYLSAGGAIVKDAVSDVTNATDSFKLRVYDAAAVLSGVMSLYLKDATNHDWISSHTMKRKTTITLAGGGSKSLSAELTQVQVMQAHSDTFSAGSINISYL